MDYISRDELRKHLADCMTAEFFDSDMKKAVVGIDVYVENMPAADVQPVKHGKWEYNDKPIFGNPYGRYCCSLCGSAMASGEDNYCPCCGARMGGDTP